MVCLQVKMRTLDFDVNLMCSTQFPRLVRVYRKMFPASKVGISSKIYQEFVGMKQFTEYIEKFIIKSTNHAKLFVCNKYTVCCME